MDDEVMGGWSIDPETRAALRLDRVRRALDQGDFGGAVIEVEELLDEDPEHSEALVLLGEALLELGDAEGAVDAYEHHLQVAAADSASSPWMIPALAGLAIARFESCDLQGAVEAARESARLAPDLAESHFYLGLALERLPGRMAEALSAFVAAQQLDPEAYPFPMQLSRKQWDDLIERARRLLPKVLQDFWKGVPFRVEDLPPIDDLRRSDPPITPTVSALYEGEPPEDGDPWQRRPEALRLFTGNLARLGSEDAVVEDLVRSMQEEALDWLGASLDDLQA
jgi:tetratricopeptide (TPR) repeat protein